MKVSRKFLLVLTCVMVALSCFVGLAACNDTCKHEWSEWTTITPVGCTAAGEQQRTCSLCEKTESEPIAQTGHNWGQWASNNNGTHTRECLNDSAHTETEDCEGGNATCTEKAVCDVCDAAYGELGNHVWGEWTSNEDGTHSRVCETNAQHTENGNCEGGNATCTDKAVCDVCDAAYGELGNHVWGEWESNEDGTHSRVCETNAQHTENGNCEGGNATCTDKAVCDVCDTAYGNLAQHVWGEWTSNEDGTHTRTCETNAQHTENGNCEGGNATCTDKAVCDICDTTYGELGNHVYGAWSANNDGTHTKYCIVDRTHQSITEDCHGGEVDGCTDKPVCEDCHTEYGEAAGHAWDDGVLTAGRLCTDDGTMVYACGSCGQTRTEVVAGHDHEMAEPTVVDPTCFEPGYTLHQCDNCEYSYTDNEVDAIEHEWDGEVTCTQGASCIYDCGTTQNPSGHDHYLISSTEATCTAPAMAEYGCTRCAEGAYTAELSPALGHSLVGQETTEQLREGEDSCYFVEMTICLRCDTPVYGKETEHHRYTGALTTTATCIADGVKTLTCSDCGHTKEESVRADGGTGHDWDDGTLDTETNIRTQTCLLCDETKTSFDASAQTDAELTAEQLAATGEVKLSEVSMSLDETTKGILTGDVNVSASVLSGDDLKAAKEKLGDKVSQLGTNQKIFNFTLSDETGLIKDFKDAEGNDGYITITIPYTLDEGEDVDNIAVWFLDGDTPVSIKATYNNGYVTFQTNHFSTYTVTKLTAEERCALYGHNDVTQTKEGDCLTDGYTLTVCLRCGRAEKEITHIATGHDLYEAGELCVEATCTENGCIVQHCHNCDYELSTLTLAIGHQWGEGTVTPATCYQAGQIAYNCANCTDEKVVVLPRTLHAKATEIVDATCETQGYTRTYCENDGCDYEVNTDVVSAIGHEYTHEFVWSEVEGEYIATLVLTCANDSEHVLEIEASLTEEVIESSCSAAGSKKLIARATYNGEGYTEIKIIQLGEASHQEINVFDEDAHGVVCAVCGTVISTEAHQFGEPDVITQPTCGEAGQQIEACQCGYEKLTEIPATGEHNFEEGVCTGCGQEEGTCDHTLGEWLTVDMAAQYGACGGTLRYKTCQCGQEFYGDFESFQSIPCRFEMSNMNQGMDETDGMPYMKVTQTCTDCGLVFDFVMKQGMSDNPCVGVQYTWFTMSIGEQIITQNGYTEGVMENHSMSSEVVINFADYGACAGYLQAYACVDCGQITSLTNMQFGCTIDQNKTQMGTDENGNMVAILDDTCTLCGLVYHQKMWQEVQGCNVLMMIDMKLSRGGVVIAEVNDLIMNVQSNHVWEYEVTMNGATCDEGWSIRKTCSICGNWQAYGGSGHSHIEKEFYTEGTTACPGTYIMYTQCEICGECQIHDMQLGCANSTDEQHSETIDGIQHNYNVTTCPDCGMVTTSDIYQVALNQCITNMVNEVIIQIDGEVALQIKMVMSSGNHNYETTFNGFTGNCEDGYTIVNTCTQCGNSYNTEWQGHYHVERAITLEGTCCQAHIGARVCVVCDEVDNVMGMEGTVCEGMAIESIPYQDDNGVQHVLMTRSCARCGLTITEDVATIQESICVSKAYYTCSISMGGEVVFSWSQTMDSITHDYQYEYVGGSCADRLVLKANCANCGHSEQRDYYQHALAFDRTVGSGKYDICPGTKIGIQTCYCGENVDVSDNHIGCKMQYEPIDATVEGASARRGVCLECGLVLTIEEYRVATSPCEREHYTKLTAVFNGEVILDGLVDHNGTETTHASANRTTNLLGDGCEDGWTHTEECTACGYSYTSEVRYEHFTFEDVSYDSDSLGACYGQFSVYSCPCGKEQGVNIGGCWIYKNDNAYEQDGQLVEVWVYGCDNCGIVVNETRRTTENPENCMRSVETTFSISKQGELKAYYEMTTEEEMHSTTRTIALAEGCADCDQGIVITESCQFCDYSNTYNSNGHEAYVDEKFDLALYGSECGGALNVKKCACGMVYEFDTEGIECDFDCASCDNWNEYAESAPGFWGVYMYFENEAYAYTCAVTDPQCTFAYRLASYWAPIGNCTAVKAYTIQLGYDALTGTAMLERTYTTTSAEPYHDITGYGDEYGVTHHECSGCDGYSTLSMEENEYGDRTIRTEFYSAHELDYYDYYLEEEAWGIFVDALGKEHNVLMIDYHEERYKNGETSWYRDEYQYEFGTTEIEGETCVTISVVCTSTRSDVEGVYAVLTKESFEYKGYEFCTLDRMDSVDNYVEYVKTYDFSDNCTANVVHTTIWDGKEDVQRFSESAHPTVYWHTVKEATCSQSGLSGDYCPVCEHVDNVEITNPHGHAWSYVEENGYVCDRCELHNANGADGEVILEDMSEKYGNGENYVVGYWNGGNVEFVSNVTIVLNNVAEGENNEVILEGIQVELVSRDYVAAVFSRQSVLDAASALGYAEGDYAVKFVFVPLYGDGQFDYAITF